MSKELINRYIKYMKDVHGVYITPEEAQISLNVLADTYISFSDIGKSNKKTA